MKLFWAVLSGACCTGHIVVAEPQITYNSFGMPGLIDMPSAQSAPDAELIFSVSQSGKSLRNTLTFQISPRLTGAFRYSAIGRPTDTLYDRSFDLRYRLLDETERRPSVAVGLQDFIGTGVYSGEYVAASKNLGPIVATAGIGWGRLGLWRAALFQPSRRPSQRINWRRSLRHSQQPHALYREGRLRRIAASQCVWQ